MARLHVFVFLVFLVHVVIMVLSSKQYSHQKPNKWCINIEKEKVVANIQMTLETLSQANSKLNLSPELFFGVPAQSNSSNWYEHAMRRAVQSRLHNKGRITIGTPHIRIGELEFYGNDYLDFLIFDIFFRNNHHAHSQGTYFETGASNGIHASNSLMFEDFLHWEGVLVEPTICAICQLALNRPRSHHFHGAVCANFTTFDATQMSAFCPGAQRKCSSNPVPTIQCAPTSHYLSKAGISTVDFMSIDVEMHFMNVLRSIDWANTNVKVLLVECDTAECYDLLTTQGYTIIKAGEIPSIKVDSIAWKNDPQCSMGDNGKKPGHS